MTKQVEKKSEFQILLKSVRDAHEKEVRALKREILKLEEKVRDLKQSSISSSSLMTDIEEIMSKGYQAREKMKLYATTGKGKPTQKDWEALIRMYEIEHHDFMFFILASSKGMLSGRDFFISILARDGWKGYDIQMLLNISSERVSNIFRKINSTIFDMDTSKSFEQNIQSLSLDKRVFNFPNWIP